MKNILERAKKFNILFLIMLGFIVYCLFSNFINFDNDLWFILATGRNILNNGIPKFDMLSMHSDYLIVTQQWLTSIIYYLTALKLGAPGLSILVSVISLAGLGVLYKYSKYLSKNTTISSLLLIIYIYFFVKGFTTSRPQIFSYLIFTSEMYLVDLFIKSKNKKYLYALPILSLLEINLHASVWLLQFCFLGVFLFDYLKDKSIRRPLVISLIIMFIIGLINPYGIDAITYVFRSYGIAVINEHIQEMATVTIEYFLGKVLLLTLFMVLFASSLIKKNKLRYFLLLGGTCYLALSHYKSFPYYGIAFVITMSYLLGDINLKDIYLNIVNKIKFTKLKNIFIGLSKCSFKYIKLGLFVTVLLLFFESYQVAIKQSNFNNDLDIIANKIAIDARTKDVTIYTNFLDGGYLEYKGFKPYLDPRADVFVKDNNKKFDLLDEAFGLNTRSNIKRFVRKYNFDYYIVSPELDSYLYNYLKDEMNDKYEQLYRSFGDNDRVLFKRIK